MVDGARQKVAVAWSSGKDSAWLLSELMRDERYEVAAIMTTVREDDGSIGIHGTSREVLYAQVAAIGLPLYEVNLPWPCPNEDYEQRMRECAYLLLGNDITALAFGDLHLADIREYREKLFAETGLDLLFPLWQRDTGELAQEMIAGGLQAVVCCVQHDRLPAELLGRRFDAELLSALPEDVDHCGESGEFHTIVTACPAMSVELELERCEMHADDQHSWLDFSEVE
ncbi:MAG: ATP-binding protein [Planctomycetales bacterium]|nr:ATP-binding protein [bacterium]UNM06981.1 MAG: ATP-binding protein [Planctomycetales bacterium]